MPLLRNTTVVENDPWICIDDEQALEPDQDHRVISLARFVQRATDAKQLPKGVSIAPDDDISALAPYLEQVHLICLEFPVYTDGRGYSHARLLRKRFGYSGELRAIGDIRVDQISFMQRMGITSFDCSTLPDTTLVQQLTARFEHNYQTSYPLPPQG